jgi:eukaryotic-like serine/threonine-protein kinase
MGVVYRAFDTHLDRPVAIKILPQDVVSDSERKKRFVQEARSASALSHPNILTIHDIDSVDGVQFIVMEYVPGKSLDRLIGRKGLDVPEALHYSIQVVDGLSAAHRAGIVHRDLKPSNIMVNPNGRIKLLDFGLAKLTEPSTDGQGETRSMAIDEQPRTAEGTIVGTVNYMSPEQAEAKAVDARSDIFSFGSVLYEMITGRRAFDGASKLATLSAILHQEPKQLGAPGEMPPGLEKIVTRCLRKNPARRFQSTDDLKIALEELKEESESGAGVPLPRTSKSRIWIFAPTMLLVASVGAALWLTRFRTAPAEAPMTAVPLTTYAGLEQYSSFSPDGNQIAFVWSGEDQLNYDIYVKLIDAGSPLRLTNDPARDDRPAWSPDGRFIAFLRTIGSDRAAVMVIPALGGAERKLTEIFITTSDFFGGSGLTWSPDGKHLVVMARKAPVDPIGLFVLFVDTGEKRSLINPPVKSIGDGAPAVSNDRRYLAFSRSPSYAISDLWVLSLTDDLRANGEPRRLTSDNRRVRGCAWTPNSREIIFSSDRTGSTALWRIAILGNGTPVRLTSVGEDGWLPAISRPVPGRAIRLAYTRTITNRDIYRLDVQSGARRPLISSTRDDHAARYSPDGTRIVFSSDRSGAHEIWMCHSDGSNLRQLTSYRGPISDLPAWSPDGRHIAFHSRPDGTADIFVMNVDGGGPRRLTIEPGDDVAPTWSSDGRWIYFGSNRAGDHQIWRMPADGGTAVQVTRSGGIYAQESHDRRLLFYTKTRGNAPLWKAPLSAGGLSGPEERIVDAIFYLSFDVRPEGVYISTKGSIQLLPLTGGAALPFRGSAGQRLSVAPDRKFVLSEVGASTSDLMLVENFR